MYPNNYCHKCNETPPPDPEVVVPVCGEGEVCESIVKGDCVKYTGYDIPCLGITTNMSLNDMVEAMAAIICSCSGFDT